ncbi:MAG TPA: Ppx/GppA phosphatase family protein [Burkholderiales bacterium]|nr:Ppx/GppA phosphatase family protein [Burkholderiales bacterium]
MQIARVVDDQVYPLDSLRGTVRLAAGLTPDNFLDEAAEKRAIECLNRFGERLRGLPAHAVRAVGTNTFRVATNASEFLEKAEIALGFPIEVIAGQEEARLIYLGVAHGLPASDENRLVIDIGGGSTEFIIGSRLTPLKLASLYMGCVSYSLRFFPEGSMGKTNMKQAELSARLELQGIAGDFSREYWGEAIGSSGTARSLSDVLEQSGFSQSGITMEGLEKLRAHLIKVGDVKRLQLPGLRPERMQILPGGFSIMYAAFRELGIERMNPAKGALRQGVLYDMLGRFHHKDMRVVTTNQFMKRYHVDQAQARRVDALSSLLGEKLVKSIQGIDAEYELQHLSWAAMLHEIGISVAHNAYHKHSAYILANADMPGFSKKEQARLSLLVLGHKGSLSKMLGMLHHPADLSLIFSLRMASLFHRSRADVALPAMDAEATSAGFNLYIQSGWLSRNPLTSTALKEEIREWKSLEVDLKLIELKR